MNRLTKFATATLMVAALAGAATAQPKPGPKPTTAPVANLPVLSGAGAQAAIAAAVKTATDNGWGSSIAVVDNAGRLLAFHRTDGAPLGTIDVAQGKALTAIKFKAPTDFIAQMVSKSAALATIPDIVAVPGGYPILKDGQVIGAIGVSGGMAGEDDIIAKAGIAAVGG